MFLVQTRLFWCRRRFFGFAQDDVLVVGLVGEDLFAAGGGDAVDGGGELERGAVGVVGVLPEEDALGLGPLAGDGFRGFEEVGGVGEEGAVPEVGGAAFG